MRGNDLAVKRRLGINPGETARQRREAQRKLSSALSARGAPAIDFTSIAGFLARTPSRLLVVAIEDALGVCDQANLAATVDEYPNWRRRLPVAVEDMKSQASVTAVTHVIVAADRGAR